MSEPRTPDLWVEGMRCPVEGCRYQVTPSDGCGLAKLFTTEESIALWDAGHPVERACLAARRAEDIF